MLLAGLNGWISVTFKVPTIVVTLAMNMVHIGFYVTFLPNAGWVLNLSDSFTCARPGTLLRPRALHLRDRGGRGGPVHLDRQVHEVRQVPLRGRRQPAGLDLRGHQSGQDRPRGLPRGGAAPGRRGHPQGDDGEPAHALGFPGPGDDLHRGGGGRRRQHHGRLGQAARGRFRRRSSSTCSASR